MVDFNVQSTIFELLREREQNAAIKSPILHPSMRHPPPLNFELITNGETQSSMLNNNYDNHTNLCENDKELYRPCQSQNPPLTQFPPLS